MRLARFAEESRDQVSHHHEPNLLRETWLLPTLSMLASNDFQLAVRHCYWEDEVRVRHFSALMLPPRLLCCNRRRLR